eukprot:TRINITY_DN17717_c3_g1_i3.p2 TRINITY_DN17717_c3_g1~~TRINITY_DN17717_c3_g1_i3.p2  ORF type:complete len:172 (-),score=38.99 TRINITY_DN17717_c3_g1_i3:415-870(-)
MDSVQAAIVNAVGGADPVNALLSQVGGGDAVEGLGKLLREDLKDEYSGLVGSHADQLQAAGFSIGDQLTKALIEKYGGEADPVEGERVVGEGVEEECKKLLEENMQEPLLIPVLMPLMKGVMTPIMDPEFKEKLSVLIAKTKLGQYFPCFA